MEQSGLARRRRDNGGSVDCCYVLKRFPQLTQTFVAEELCELERQGTRLAVVARGGPSSATAATPVGLRARVHYVPDDRLGDGAAAKVRALGAAHVHAHFAGWAADKAAQAAARGGFGYSFTAHATDIYRDDVDEPRLSALMAGARFVITVTDANRRRLEQVLSRHGRDGHVVRIYNGVDLRRLRPTEAGRDEQHIVGVGRLVEKKGHPVLIDAIGRLRDEGRNVRCTIVGSGPLQSDLEQQVRAAGLDDRVTLLGDQNRDAVLDLLRRATIFALPSVVAADGDRDALPTVILESMALGTPVISTTVSGIPEMVEHGSSGLLVAPHDPGALTAAMRLLLDSPAMRHQLGRGGRGRVEADFDLEKNVSALRELIEAQTE